MLLVFIIFNIPSFLQAIWIVLRYAKIPGADPGFLERGFICIKVCGVCYADLISFLLNIQWKRNVFGLTETKLFHFHRIFKSGGLGGRFKQTPSGSAISKNRVRTDPGKSLNLTLVLEFEKKVPFVLELSWNFVKSSLKI